MRKIARRTGPLAKARKWYWAIQSLDGELRRPCEDCAPNLYYYKPWTSIKECEKAVKVRITKIK